MHVPLLLNRPCNTYKRIRIHYNMQNLTRLHRLLKLNISYRSDTRWVDHTSTCECGTPVHVGVAEWCLWVWHTGACGCGTLVHVGVAH